MNILQINEYALTKLKAAKAAPPVVARSMFLLHEAMYRHQAQYKTAAHVVLAKLGLSPSGIEPNLDVQTVSEVSAYVEARALDGSNQLNNYKELVSASRYNMACAIVKNDGAWKPVHTQKFLLPHWGKVDGYAVDKTTVDSLRPSGRTSIWSKESLAEIKEVADVWVRSDATESAIALYWADGPRTTTPPGHWNEFAVELLAGQTEQFQLETLFLLNAALFDASIVTWNTKRFYNTVRPISALQRIYRGFQSLIGTPPFPEYTSGHSAFSMAGATILKDRLGTDTFGKVVTFEGITWALPTLTGAAVQAGKSRIYGGIHFKRGDLDGQLVGRQAAERVLSKFSQE